MSPDEGLSVGRSVGKLRSMANEIPQTLDKARVLKYAQVTAAVDPTGKTRHLRGGARLGPASALAVAKYEDGEGYYLFYLDDEGRVMTDTWHESVDRALAQADVEYVGLTWSDASDQRHAGCASVRECPPSGAEGLLP